jgi:hypothetical protein
MTENTQKRIEVAANLGILITAILLCVVLAKSLVSAPESVENRVPTGNQPAFQTNRRPNPIPPGTNVSLEGVDWSKNGRTLLLALSSKCHFCTESAPFYQRLARERSRARLIALVPHTVDEGKRYLEELKVDVDEVRQVPFGSLGVRGTPTIILVGDQGSTIKSWVGKLASNTEAEVLAALN